MKIEANTDNRKMSEEEKRLIESLSSLAALLGNSLFYYGRTVLNVTFDQYEEIEAAAAAQEDDLFTLAADPDKAELEAAAARAKGTTFKEPESPGTQIIQLLTLLHPDVRQIMGTSAIYPILSEVLKLFDRTGETIEEQINGLNLVPLAGVWIITKRVFAFGHQQDCFAMFDTLLEAIRSRKQPEPLKLTEITDTDRENAAVFYESYFGIKPTAAVTAEEKTEPVEEKPDAAAPKLETLTEIISTDKIIMSSSKAARNMITIAEKEGTASIDVGRGVKIKARITGKNGEKIVHLTRLDYDVMQAVGQIFMENGFKEIIITPDQIFKTITKADPAAKVSDTAVSEIVASLDKLITTPATLDFKEQIEKHTRLKAKPYGNREGILKGNLVSGMHMESHTTTYKGRIIEHAFKIYDLPMFVYYSYAIGQLVTVPGHYLTGSQPVVNGQKKSAAKKEARQRLNLKDAGLRRYLLEKIEYTKKQKENRDKKLLYRKQTPPKTYQAKLSFSTIAEEIGYELDSEKRKRTVREQTFSFMQEQVRMGNIISCEYYYIGRALSGIEITV